MSAPFDKVGMKHGAGGRAMRELIGSVMTQGLADPPGGIGLSAMDDGGAVPLGDGRWLVLTADSHVIHPRIFPGGDIGRLSIAGTVNDLAMMGATEVPLITVGVILEEGFPRAELEIIQKSLRETIREAGGFVITGDTKVMGKGEIDGLVISTAGAGITSRVVRDSGLRAGDVLIVTGGIAEHGMAVMTARHALKIEGDLKSDVAPINGLIRAALLAGGEDVVAMKDPTRGGLSSSIHEMAQKGGVGVILRERAVPVSDAVRAAAELLGIEPLQVANEGKAVIGVRAASAHRVLEALREHPLGREAAIIGEAVADHPGRVILDTGIGRRLLVEPEAEPLPRIC